MVICRSFLSAIFLVFSLDAFTQTRIDNINIIDVKNGKVIPAQSVVLSDGVIATVGKAKSIKSSADVTIIDGKGQFLMPGLADAHIHFFQSGGLYTRPDAVDLRARRSYAKELGFARANVADYLLRYLRLGITTVIDVGGPFLNFVVRDSVAKSITSPNVLVTGPLFSIVASDKLDLGDPPIVKISSEASADSLFEKMLPRNPDFIKIWYISNSANPAAKSFPIVKYIAEQSHKHGLKLTVHATELETAKFAVDAGADILVHSIDDKIIPDDFAQLLKQKKISYIPTLIVGSNYGRVFSGKLPHHSQDIHFSNPFAYSTLSDPETMSEDEMPPVVRHYRKYGLPSSDKKADSISAINLFKLATVGVNIATGTDAGNIGTMHASSYLIELEAMSRAGLSNAQLLKASTYNVATAFGKEKEWGSIEKGKKADLLLLQKNPMENIQHLNSISLVFKNGRMLVPDSILRESPEAIVQRQVNAYNAKNIEEFMNTYSADVELYDFPQKVFVKGKDEMKKMYSKFFSESPSLYCEIENRIVMGNTIIDKEKVRRGKQIIHAVAIYEVVGGKIKNVTFIE